MTDSTSTDSAEQRNRKDKQNFLLILAVFILPFIVVPMLMSPEERPKTNKGNFVQPHVLFDELSISGYGDKEFDRSLVKGKWVLLYFLPLHCEQACRNSLYAIRQVRKALDRDVDRVRQLVVSTSPVPQELDTLLKTGFGEMLRAQAKAQVIDAAFSKSLTGEQVSQQGYIYMMSPDGYIFMYYPAFADEQESILHARDIRKDLKKSLKGSLIG